MFSLLFDETIGKHPYMSDQMYTTRQLNGRLKFDRLKRRQIYR